MSSKPVIPANARASLNDMGSRLWLSRGTGGVDHCLLRGLPTTIRTGSGEPKKGRHMASTGEVCHLQKKNAAMAAISRTRTAAPPNIHFKASLGEDSSGAVSRIAASDRGDPLADPW